jgi:integrase
MTAQLKKKLPKVSSTKRSTNHPSLPYAEMGAFMASLREREGVATLALELAILTAARTGEVIGATWKEMNLKQSVWDVPAGRMKGGRSHRAPLSAAALHVLHRVKAYAVGDVVFPSLPRDRALSNMALLTVLRRMGRSDLTVHGFRSTFRTWAAERTNIPREVCEAALAHVIKDKTEAAYQRGDMFEKRVRLMEEWAEFCAPSE